MQEGKQVVSTRGAAAAGPEEAARVGARILAQGGNAMDAAAATSLACCMLHPAATGVAGYVCAALVLEGETGRVWSVDGNSIAPAAAREDMFETLPPSDGKSLNEREYSCCVKDDANVHGPLAVGVPGMMAGMGVIWERWGRLKWPDICAPAQKIVADGFQYGGLANSIKAMEKVIRRFEPTREHLMPDGKPPRPTDVCHRPDMAGTLERIASAGWRDFYTGEIGRKIADYIESIGGILSREDMASFEPRVTDPYKIAYRGADVHGPILTNGAISAMQALCMLETLDVARDRTVDYWHRLAEIMKLVWRDRLTYLADPDFVEAPIERLLGKDYAWGRTETIRQFPRRVDGLVFGSPGDAGHGTLHVSTADVEGNLVAMTISQGGAFGSCVTVPGTGLILGHGMCRLDPRPGLANSIAPRKRPLNNTAPLLLKLPDRDVALGLPGGRRLVGVSAQLAQRIVDFGATAYEAASAPRLHVLTHEPVEMTESVGAETIEAMRAMGHNVKAVKAVAGGAHIAEVLKDEKKVRAGGNTWAAGV